ncbi:hypothetical protein DFH08DRAFT_806895 [Mycena albidolilacea]|uniref:Uncharacterized protein n=1 Tax=Mycena albidolilacea TaxID=1033008 RepID=A0AAD7A773_9AGAR|nr:hypothetical protein DFH08DRAFT_806895 [Mycena albidolilacea]
METTLQELRAHITASGFQSPAPNHASISAYIEKHIIKNSKSLFKERAPPLDIVLYAIRLLLGAPTDAPRLGDIPDLLDFATTIEFYRKLALQKVDEALTFQRYYQANNDGPTTLTDEEVERLHQYTRDGPEVRTVYIEMILQYCQWDIYHLWTSDPPCPTDVTLRLCEYFPNLNSIYRNKGATSPRLFHYDLTDAEREVLRLRGIDCCTFVSDSCDWASARQTELPGHQRQTLANVFQTSEFAEVFPCKIQLATLRGSMDYYMSAVETMVNELQEMFPPS